MGKKAKTDNLIPGNGRKKSLISRIKDSHIAVITVILVLCQGRRPELLGRNSLQSAGTCG